MPEQVLAAARAALPFWVPWGGALLDVLLALVLPWLLVPLALRRAVRRAEACDDAPWHEVARARWPVAVSGAFLVVVTAVLAGCHAVVAGGPLAPGGGVVAAVAAVAVALASGRAALRWTTRRMLRPDAKRDASWRGAVALSWILLAPFWIALATAAAMPWRFDAGVVPPLLAGALLTAWYALGGVLTVPRWLGVLGAPRSDVQDSAAAALAAAGLTGVATFELRAPSANAFALPLRRALVVTGAAADTLQRAELDAILAHEVAHLAEPRRRAAWLSLRVFALLPLTLLPPLGADLGPWWAFAAFLPTVLLLATSRRMAREFEERADRHAAGREAAPGVYARALERLHRANLVPAVLPGRRQAHPHLYDRMVAAGVTPGFERPAPPDPRAQRAASIGGVVALTVVFLGLQFLHRALSYGALGAGLDPEVRLMVTGGDAPVAAALAAEREQAGDERGAAALRGYAAFTRHASPYEGLAWLARDRPAAALVSACAAKVEADLDRHAWSDAYLRAGVAELWLGADARDAARAVADEARDRGAADQPDDPYWRIGVARVLAGLGDADGAAALALASRERTVGDYVDDPRLALEQAEVARQLGDAELHAQLEERWRALAGEQGRLDELEAVRFELRARAAQ